MLDKSIVVDMKLIDKLKYSSVISLLFIASCSPTKPLNVSLLELAKNINNYEGKVVSVESEQNMPSCGRNRLGVMTFAEDRYMLAYKQYSLYCEAQVNSEEKCEEIMKKIHYGEPIRIEGKVRNSKLLIKNLWVNNEEYKF